MQGRPPQLTPSPDFCSPEPSDSTSGGLPGGAVIYGPSYACIAGPFESRPEFEGSEGPSLASALPCTGSPPERAARPAWGLHQRERQAAGAGVTRNPPPCLVQRCRNVPELSGPRRQQASCMQAHTQARRRRVSTHATCTHSHAHTRTHSHSPEKEARPLHPLGWQAGPLRMEDQAGVGF